MPRSGRALRTGVAALMAALVLAPIVAGLVQTVRAGLGILPAIGAETVSGEPLRSFLATPGLTSALRITLVSGLGAAVAALILATCLTAVLYRPGNAARRARFLTPFLAIPHAALGIGLVFLLSPSGWIARLIAPLAGWERPPMLATVQDEYGLGLMIGLIIKETPFLVFMMLVALNQIPVARLSTVSRSLGYSAGQTWIKVIMPQVWPLIRLPVMVVMAYGLSTVDMALLLGPSTPPSLAVVLLRLFLSPDSAALLPASAGALVQIGLMAACLLLLLAVQRGVAGVGRAWCRRGDRGGGAAVWLRVGTGVLGALLALGALAMISVFLWSLAWRWSWPDILPSGWSLQNWSRAGAGWRTALGHTLALAGASTAVSLLLAIAWLEAEDRGQFTRARWAEGLIYLPLLIPQIGFLYGLNVAFLHMGLNGAYIAVIWAHAIFVFPYVMIALSDPWRALDPRLLRSAAALGAGPWRRLYAVKLPLLWPSILATGAIGISVSVAQYLPTLFVGAGRTATLTTEAVTLASGADRRVTGVYATLQMIVPLLAFALATALPGVRIWRRPGLGGGIS